MYFSVVEKVLSITILLFSMSSVFTFEVKINEIKFCAKYLGHLEITYFSVELLIPIKALHFANTYEIIEQCL